MSGTASPFLPRSPRFLQPPYSLARRCMTFFNCAGVDDCSMCDGRSNRSLQMIILTMAIRTFLIIRYSLPFLLFGVPWSGGGLGPVCYGMQTVSYLNASGIRRVLVGHQPVGNCPAPIRVHSPTLLCVVCHFLRLPFSPVSTIFLFFQGLLSPYY